MLSRSEANLLHGLQRRKSRETEGLFLAEGVRVAEERDAPRVGEVPLQTRCHAGHQRHIFGEVTGRRIRLGAAR